MKVFKLPDLGEGLPEAEVNEWHVKVGDSIEVDQPLVSMETAKAVVEVPAPQTGVIAKLYGQPGDIIETGAPLVEFVEEDAASPEPAKTSSTVVGNIETSNTLLEESATGVQPTRSTTPNVKVIPAVRALAKRLNVDLTAIKPTGAKGLITADDVKQAANQTSAFADLPGEEIALRGVRRTMATSMAQSHRDIVPVTLVDDADIHHWPKGTDITIRIIRAISQAAQEEPALNAWYDGTRMVCKHVNDVNIGLALDSKDGLFVPVLKAVNAQTDEALRQTIDRFKQQAADRSLPQDDLKNATITLSNFGTFAGRYANPIIVPPTVAILGVGRFRDEVVAAKGQPEVHRILPLSLTFDHRAATGGEASRFLATLIAALQKD